MKYTDSLLSLRKVYNIILKSRLRFQTKVHSTQFILRDNPSAPSSSRLPHNLHFSNGWQYQQIFEGYSTNKNYS